MVRFILRCRMKDRSNGLETDSLYTVDCDAPDLECLLLQGGFAENGYEYHEVIGVEVFPPRATGTAGGEGRAPSPGRLQLARPGEGLGIRREPPE